MTQSSSSQRCKVDLIGDNGLQVLFKLYETETQEDFRQTCIEFIKSSSGKKDTKQKFVNILESSNSKDKILKTTTNYIMAGQGYGV